MGGQNSWPQNITFSDWMRDVEKRVLHEERRPQIRSAADLLGPGFGPYAIQIRDWNDDITAFDGFFWSPVGSLNSPDGAKAWMGNTTANADGSGFQIVTDYAETTNPPVRWMRRFSTPTPGAARVFSSWMNTVTPPTVLPSGLVRRVAWASTTTASALTAATTAILSVSIPVARNGYTYRAYLQTFLLNDTATAFTSADLRSGTPATTASTSFMNGLADHRAASRRQTITLIGEFPWTGTDGATNLTVMATFTAGSNNSQAYADANRPNLLIVDEVAP